MIRQSILSIFKIGVVFFLLVGFLFWDKSSTAFPRFITSSVNEVSALVDDSGTQWMIYACLGIYLATFLYWRFSGVPAFWGITNPDGWLVGGLLLGALVYGLDYEPSTGALALLGGVVLGQGVSLWAGRNFGKDVRFLVLLLLVILLAGAGGWSVDAGRAFEFRGQLRWSGPWNNPNIFGLFMGSGVVLAAGLLVQNQKSLIRWPNAQSQVLGTGNLREVKNWKSTAGKYIIAVFYFAAVILLARGLLHSYSRGAWLATGCGLIYLFMRSGTGKGERAKAETSGVGELQSPMSKVQSLWNAPGFLYLKRNGLPLAVILASISVLFFWHFRQTEWHPARRAFSVVNPVDFSWRNRLSAWEGALQITAEHPWFGTGWNQPEPLYQKYYLPAKLTEGLAIEMNDYLMLGATLGIPALLCFGMYLCLVVSGKAKSRKAGKRETKGKEEEWESVSQGLDWVEMNWQRTVCHAGAMVLLVGFWFDGGLFKLPTAATFWILLELGRQDRTIARSK